MSPINSFNTPDSPAAGKGPDKRGYSSLTTLACTHGLSLRKLTALEHGPAEAMEEQPSLSALDSAGRADRTNP
ncbi:MAG: hypothetical protein WBQ94_29715 [Terracidiphilus sp.]